MTEEQKFQIRKLRNEGLGYYAIAKTMNISRSSVRSYCKSNGIYGSPQIREINVKERIKNGEACAYCAGPIKKASTGRPARFCSGECRRNYWKIHRAEGYKSPSATYIMECAYCHNTFSSYGNKHRKYCCHEHYILDRFGDIKGGADANSTTDDAVHIITSPG